MIVLLSGFVVTACTTDAIPKGKVDDMVKEAVKVAVEKQEGDLADLRVQQEKWWKEEARLNKEILEKNGKIAELSKQSWQGRNPTPQEISAFVSEHNKRFVGTGGERLGVGDYALIMYWYARLKGYNCEVVGVKQSNNQYLWFVAFTNDNGKKTHYIAYPASEVKLEVGKSYKELNPQYSLMGDDKIINITYYR